MSALQHPSFEIPCCPRLSAGSLALALESLAPLCPCSAQTLGVVTRALRDASLAERVRCSRASSAQCLRRWFSRRSLACRDRRQGSAARQEAHSGKGSSRASTTGQSGSAASTRGRIAEGGP